MEGWDGSGGLAGGAGLAGGVVSGLGYGYLKYSIFARKSMRYLFCLIIPFLLQSCGSDVTSEQAIKTTMEPQPEPVCVTITVKTVKNSYTG